MAGQWKETESRARPFYISLSVVLLISFMGVLKARSTINRMWNRMSGVVRMRMDYQRLNEVDCKSAVVVGIEDGQFSSFPTK